jgi:hypothetical protein
MSLHASVRQQLQNQLAGSQSDEQRQLNDALRLLSKWRSILIQNTLLQHNGLRVMDGPFKGMDFLAQSAEGCHIAKLLGCYEQPLFPHIEQAIGANYSTILNIGCAEGYYAVGMARRMPGARIHACDADPRAREICAQLAAKNGVADRLTIGGLFKPEDFAAHAHERFLVICDIEGAEKDLLSPAASQSLASADLIVESHECLAPGVTQHLMDRFKATHDIALIEDDGQRHLNAAPAWFKGLAHLDQLLAVWEWRSGPTPWLVMTARRGPAR